MNWFWKKRPGREAEWRIWLAEGRLEEIRAGMIAFPAEQHGLGPALIPAIIAQNDLPWLALLIGNGLNPNAPDAQGAWPLVAAAAEGWEAGAMVLLAAGAMPNVHDRFGVTALMYAARWGAVSLGNALLAAGADVDQRDQEGETALMYATAASQWSMLECLLAAGAQSRLLNFEGMNAWDKISDPTARQLWADKLAG